MDDTALSMTTAMTSAMGGRECGPTSLQEERRPSSSLSTSSRASCSRIPVLSRSASLRVKKRTTWADDSGGGGGQQGKAPGSSSSRGGVVRSASFVTSRGVTETVTMRRTPVVNREARDRKAKSYAGLGASSWHPSFTHPSSTPTSSSSHHHNHHNHHSHHSHHHHHSSRQQQHHTSTPPTTRRHPRRPSSLSVSSDVSSPLSPKCLSLPVTPGGAPQDSSRDGDQDDGDSDHSFGSVSSAVSCDAGVRGGAGRRYVVHCSHGRHGYDPDSYLTPTQRAARAVRELKSQLATARKQLQTREAEICRLKQELVQLRLDRVEEQEETRRGGESTGYESTAFPASTPPPLPAVAARTPTSTNTPTPPSEGSEPELSKLMNNLSIARPASAGSVADTPTTDSADLGDSGQYTDDLTSPSLSTRDPFETSLTSRRSLRRRRGEEGGEEDEEDEHWLAEEQTEARLRAEFGRREEQLKRNHMDEYCELKEKHNDRVEALLAKLSEANLKYFELRPQYDQSQERVRELEREVARLKGEVAEAEIRHQKMYLQMFLKGQQAARLQDNDEQVGLQEVEEEDEGGTVSIGALLQRLAHTEDELEKTKALYQHEVAFRTTATTALPRPRNGASDLYDPEVTLQFLKSAVYYYLTDKDNARGHLRAIESILGYSDTERGAISKVVK